MGISYASARFLLEAAEGGVSFARTATIGRQTLMASPIAVGKMLKGRGRRYGGGTLSSWLPTEPWADSFLQSLGAQEITSLDASSYEGADLIADLNDPVEDGLSQRFSAVFDGGSLEHVFNAPEALRSYMRMVEVGGHVLITVPANNYFGHGFYQFGPEFFYRALSEQNGFAVERMIAANEDVDSPGRLLGREFPVLRSGSRFQVADPKSAGVRVQLVNSRPVLLLVQARRIGDAAPYAQWPQQSDYSRRWSSAREADQGFPDRPVGTTSAFRLFLARELLPRIAPLVDPARRARSWHRRSFLNRRHYRRLKR